MLKVHHLPAEEVSAIQKEGIPRSWDEAEQTRERRELEKCT
jgi:hypothetical protein